MSFKPLGFGLGLRTPHYAEIVQTQHEVEWFEALTENYLGLPGNGPGPSLARLLSVRERFPITLHGVSLSIGSADPLSRTYLAAVAELANRVEPRWISDHLCFTGVQGRNSHDLLPLPYTRETVRHVVSRIQEVQEYWKRPLVLENVSSYVSFAASDMPEWEFLRSVANESGCLLLLDVNNIYVSSRNHRFAAKDYLARMPWQRVVQIHLAGHTETGDVVIDTHNTPVRTEVWELYREAIRQAPHAATMIEWDSEIPPFRELERELLKAKGIAHEQIT